MNKKVKKGALLSGKSKRERKQRRNIDFLAKTNGVIGTGNRHRRERNEHGKNVSFAHREIE